VFLNVRIVFRILRCAYTWHKTLSYLYL